MGAKGFRPLYLGMGNLDQPLYCYYEGSNGSITAEYVGYRIIDRTLGVNWITLSSAITGNADWSPAVDMVIDWYLLANPTTTLIGVVKVSLDTLSVAYHTIKDSYHYGLEFSLTEW